MLLNETSTGLCSILATPFTENGALDRDSLGTLIEFYLGHGSSAVTILGMMGEAPKLDAEESRIVIDTSLELASAVPVIVGVSSPGSGLLVQLANYSMERGAAGVMIAPIPTLRTDEQIYGYYEGVLRALGPDVPVVVQDFPAVTNVHMSAAVLGRLIEDFPQIVMIKHEDYPGLNKLSRLRKDAQDGRRRVSILTGNGGLHLPQELARGADGAMTGFAYPEMLSTVCRLFAEGRPEAAEDLYDVYLPLLRHEAQPGIGIAIRKEILRRRGAIKTAHVRMPGPRLTPADSGELDWLIARLETRIQSLESRKASQS